MSKISISIPDTLMARLEPMKPSINISQFCREALERRVEDFEKGEQHDALDVESVVKRLRDERSAGEQPTGEQSTGEQSTGEQATDEPNFEDLGKNDAERWLSTVSYPELKNIVENPHSANMSKYKLPRAAFEVMKQGMSQANVRCEGAHAVAYKTAWLEYVRSVWDRVPEEIEEPGQTRPVEEQLQEAVETGAGK